MYSETGSTVSPRLVECELRRTSKQNPFLEAPCGIHAWRPKFIHQFSTNSSLHLVCIQKASICIYLSTSWKQLPTKPFEQLPFVPFVELVLPQITSGIQPCNDCTNRQIQLLVHRSSSRNSVAADMLRWSHITYMLSWVKVGRFCQNIEFCVAMALPISAKKWMKWTITFWIHE